MHRLRTDPSGDVMLVPPEPDSTDAMHGTLTTEVLDAGQASSWRRVAVDVDAPASTRVRVEVAAASVADAPPRFELAPHDAWLPSVLGEHEPGANADPERFRFLRIRIQLESLDPARSPRLLQVRAQTAGEDYLSQLPAVYAREDAEHGHHLEHLLELFGSRFGDWDRRRQHLPRRLDPHWAPAEDLAWLAQWLGWDELPPLPTDRLRTLVEQLPELNELRGTLTGLRRIIFAFTGIEVQIVEQFRQRPLWVLGDAELGVDTGLSPLADGMVVPGDADLCQVQDDEHAVMTVGQTIVGRQGPLERERFGAPIFDEDAHRFTVFVPPGAACSDQARARLRRIIDEEKPAHADYHLCFLERMQLERNMTIGVDAYVGRAYDPEPLGRARLGQGTYVADPPGRIRIEATNRIHEGATIK